MKRCPAFHCDKENTGDVDVMTKVKVLEQSMDAFMKQQGEQMRNLTETVGNLCQNLAVPTLPRQSTIVFVLSGKMTLLLGKDHQAL
jgi:hypothetical protein